MDNLDHNKDFPPTKSANEIGLLTTGGDLSMSRLIKAYTQGIFPWFDEPPVQWWAPPVRALFITNRFYTSKKLKKVIRQNLINSNRWQISVDKAFSEVVKSCGERAEGTWINLAMKNAYHQLHQNGFAHSFELWENINNIPTLIGGVYGVGIGKMFFGESMFSRKANASKVVLKAICQWMHQNEMPILDSQVPNPHTGSLGALLFTRDDFEYLLTELIIQTKPQYPTQLQFTEEFKII